MPCYSPLKGWKNEAGGISFRATEGTTKMEVACGQCLGCRLDNSRMWAMRIVHESSLHEHSHGNSFVTLTYRDRIECNAEQLRKGYYLPDDWSLQKSHFVNFMKRLRKHFDPQRIRFFQCGEYGSTCKHGLKLDTVKCPVCTTGRPHHHAALFNCSFLDREPYATNAAGETRYTSPTLEKIWRYGFVDVGELNFQTAAYMSRYILKKVNGNKAEDHYRNVDLETGELIQLEPEYITMSRRPGLARDWYSKFKDDVFPADDVPVVGVGVLKKAPRYYMEILKHEDAITHEEIKAVREEFRKQHAHEFTPSRLHDKYKVKKAQIETFSRSL